MFESKLFQKLPNALGYAIVVESTFMFTCDKSKRYTP